MSLCGFMTASHLCSSAITMLPFNRSNSFWPDIDVVIFLLTTDKLRDFARVAFRNTVIG